MDEFVSRQMQIIEQEQWIIDGNYHNSMQLRFCGADLVIYLVAGRFTCLCRVLRRLRQDRPDIPDFLEDRFDWQFIKYVWNFPKNGPDRIMQLHTEFPGTPFVTIKGKSQLNKLLEDFNEQHR